MLSRYAGDCPKLTSHVASNQRILYHDHPMALIRLHMPITGSVIAEQVSEEEA